MTDSGTIRERPFSAKDLREAADLSYRQLNDWDQKGVMPRCRDRDRKWRKFTTREVFSIMVCSEIRKRFGVPLEHLASVLKRLLEATTDPLELAVHQIVEIGAGVWFRTDLRETAEIFPVTRFEQTTIAGTFLDGSADSMILLKLDPIVNRLRKHIDDSDPISRHQRGMDQIRESNQALTVRTRAELQLLEIIRARDFTKIEYTRDGGQKQVVRVSRKVDTKITDVEKMIAEHSYQKIEIQVKNGGIAFFDQTVTKHLSD